MAHALYPKAVPWPRDRDPKASELEVSDAQIQSMPSAPKKQAVAKVRTSFAAGTGSTKSQARVSQIDTLQGLPGQQDRIRPSVPAICAVVPATEQSEVVLCGKILRTTVRGHQVQSLCALSEVIPCAVTAVVHEDYGERALAEAAQHREEIQKVLELEYFRERRLEERIHALEQARDGELSYQEALRRKEAQRQSRQEELRLQLIDGLQRRDREEQAKRAQEKQEQEYALEAERLAQKRRDQQKEAVAEWNETCPRIGSSAEACTEARLRQHQERLEHIQEEQRWRFERRTLRQIQAAEHVQRQVDATEQRPPMPPRPHDLPAPILQMMEVRSEGRGSVTSGSGSGTARVRKTAIRTKEVSKNYGLTKEEREAVEHQLSSRVHGAGRQQITQRS